MASTLRPGAPVADAPPRQADLPIAFGPVRSRRVGWSLGINNVPPKTCTYSCVCCQVGATDRSRLEREAFLAPDVIVDAVAVRLAECRATSLPVDYATFVPDGEPTLDRNLGLAIRGVRALAGSRRRPAWHRRRPPDDRGGRTRLPRPLGRRLVDRPAAAGHGAPRCRPARRAHLPADEEVTFDAPARS
jgi:hypothetical protein